MKIRIILMLCVAAILVTMSGCGFEKTESPNLSVEIEKIPEAEEEKEAEEVQEGNKIMPLPATIDMNNLDNCTVAISLEEGGAYVDDSGAMQMDITVYTYDLYDMVDISALKEGDVIVIRNQDVTVTSLEQNDYGTLFINGELESGGYEFFTDESGVWFESGFNDAKSYYEIGKATVRVSPDFEFVDSSDLEQGDITYYPGDFLTNEAGIVYHFVPENTCVVIEDGMIIKMERRYIP